MDRSNRYEAAFEAFLRQHRYAYVAVNEQRRTVLGAAPIKNLDFIVCDPADDLRLVLDVKGRRFPAGPRQRPRRVWECWSTAADVADLQRWADAFGAGRGRCWCSSTSWPAMSNPRRTLGICGNGAVVVTCSAPSRSPPTAPPCASAVRSGARSICPAPRCASWPDPSAPSPVPRPPTPPGPTWECLSFEVKPPRCSSRNWQRVLECATAWPPREISSTCIQIQQGGQAVAHGSARAASFRRHSGPCSRTGRRRIHLL